jgi:hypothetical protein
MSAAALLAAAALAASPFQPPRVLQATRDTKCDRGTVLHGDAARGELRVTTAAGVVTYRVGPELQAVGTDGKPSGAAVGLAAGTKVRVYYVVEDGARALEVDVDPGGGAP